MDKAFFYVPKDLMFLDGSKGTVAFAPSIPAWVRVNNDSREALEALRDGENLESFVTNYANRNHLDFREVLDSLRGFLETTPVASKIPVKEGSNKSEDFTELDQVWLCPSGWCNLSCCYCAVNPPRIKPTQKPLPFWIDAVKQSVELGAKEFIVSGGEPTLYSDCIEMISWIDKNTSARTQLLTNGILLKDKDIEKLSRTKAGVQVSIDGVTSATNDSIRGKGTFERIITCVKKLLASGISTNLSMTVCKLNVDDIESMPAFAKELGCEGVRIAPYFDTGRAALKNSGMFTDEEREELVLKILRLRKTSNVRISCGMGHLELPMIGDRADLCGSANGMITINSDGGVYACPDAIQIKNSCAGFLDQEPLRKIMDCELFRKIRSTSKYDINECCTCFFRQLCGGGCLMERTYLEQIGSTYKKDCILTKNILLKIIKEEV